MMTTVFHRAVKIGLIGTIPICLFSFTCGSIHSSQCGFATFPALLLSVPAMAVASVTGADNAIIIIPLFLSMTFLWVTGFALLALSFRDGLSKWREQRGSSDRT